MASMQPLLGQHAFPSSDSLIATVLPSLGSTPDLGRMRLAGNTLRDTYPQEDAATLAGFLKAAIKGGWTTPAHLNCFSLGDDDAALRVVAHDAAWALGDSISGDCMTTLPERIASKIVHASAPTEMQRIDLLPVLKAGAKLGLYEPDALNAELTHERGITNALTHWWQNCLLQHVQSASPLADRHDCEIGMGLTSRRGDADDPTTPVQPYLAWGLARDMMAFSLNLPTEDTPEAIQLRDLILLVCAAHQAVASDFCTPTEIGSGMIGFLWEDDIERVKEELNGAPATPERVREIVLAEIPNDARDQEGNLDVTALEEHCTFESLAMRVDRTDMQQGDCSALDEWCLGVSRFISANGWMVDPLRHVGGIRGGDGKLIPGEVMEHVRGRISTETPALRDNQPAVCDTLALWVDWLDRYVARGGNSASREHYIEEYDMQEVIPMEYLIQACPGLFLEAEMGYSEQTWEHIMSGAGTALFYEGGFDDLDTLSAVIDDMICTNTLIHFLTELSTHMEGFAESPTIM